MLNKVTIEKLEVNLSDHDLDEALRIVEASGVNLKGFKVVRYLDNSKILVLQRVKDEKVTKSDLLFKANASPQRSFLPPRQDRSAVGEW